MHREASIGHHLGSQLLIVSPQTSVTACEAFSNRLREAIHAASITMGNRQIKLSISIGVSNSQADSACSARALIEMASTRLTNAQEAGGNRVLANAAGATAATTSAQTPPPTLEQALRLLREGRESAVTPHLPELGKALLPFLKLLDQTLALQLPLAEIEKRLSASSGASD